MIDSEAIQAQFDDVMDDLLPSVDIAQIVFRSGGTRNAYGEFENQDEELIGVRFLSQGDNRENRATDAGDNRPIEINFIVKTEIDLDEGMRIRYAGDDYNVTFVEYVSVGDNHIYYQGRMRKIHGD